MAKKKARQKESEMNGHALDDNGAFLPTVEQIWGKGGLTEQFRHSKLYPAFDKNKRKKFGKVAERIIRTDSQEFPTID